MLLLTILCILLTWWIGRCLQLISIGRFFRAAFRRISCETPLLELDVFDDLCIERTARLNLDCNIRRSSS